MVVHALYLEGVRDYRKATRLLHESLSGPLEALAEWLRVGPGWSPAVYTICWWYAWSQRTFGEHSQRHCMR